MEHKPKLGWLYSMIVLCVLFSAVMTWSLLYKLAQQRESAETYAELSSEVVVTGETVFPSVTTTPAETELESEAESEDQSDTISYFDQDVVVVTATPAPVQTVTVIPTATPESPPTTAPQATAAATPATASPAVTPTPSPTPTAVPTAAATATPTATHGVTPAVSESAAGRTAAPSPTTSAATPSPARTPAATATAAPSATPTVSPTVPPTATPSIPPTATPAATPSPTPTATPAPTEEPMQSRVVLMDSVHYSVDFSYLQSLNEDVKAWLIQDGTVINYPVLQGENNDYYLSHLFNGKSNKDGSIFLDSGSSDAFGDANAYIYGHHTKTDSMFSTLVNYKEQAYYDEHPQMILLTPYGDYCIDLFAAGVFQADDETSWRVKQFTKKADFTAYIQELENTSLFKADEDALPVWGDQLLVLVTCTNDRHGERYAVYGRMRQILYASTDSVTVTKMLMDQKETLSRWQEVPGRGQMMVYAQNDPLWTSMIYETRTSERRRTFGAGGCGPTSVAMAVVNLVPRERLPDIFGYAKTSLGYTFCEYSVNQYHAGKSDTQYLIQTEAEYLRYYPLVMANFATGNNLWDQVSRNSSSGTSLSFLKKIAFLYKLSLSHTSDENVALDAVREGALVICSLGANNPFTGGGHYVVLASVVDDYAYFLDPYRQADYEKHDTDHLFTQIAPGVVRVSLKDIGKLRIGTDYILNTTAMTASADPPIVTGEEDE